MAIPGPAISSATSSVSLRVPQYTIAGRAAARSSACSSAARLRPTAPFPSTLATSNAISAGRSPNRPTPTPATPASPRSPPPPAGSPSRSPPSPAVFPRLALPSMASGFAASCWGSPKGDQATAAPHGCSVSRIPGLHLPTGTACDTEAGAQAPRYSKSIQLYIVYQKCILLLLMHLRLLLANNPKTAPAIFIGSKFGFQATPT